MQIDGIKEALYKMTDGLFMLSLLCLSTFYGVLIGLAYFLDKEICGDIFSAVKVACYFATIEAIAMFWFACHLDSLYGVVLEEVSLSFISYENILIAYTLSLVMFFFYILGCFVFSYHFKLCATLGDILQVEWVKSTLGIWVIILSAGLCVFVLFLDKLGGLLILLENMAYRTSLTAGLGLEQILYSNLVLLGGLFLAVNFLSRKKLGYFFLVTVVVLFVESVTGSRWYVLLFFWMLMLLYHYKVNVITKLLSLRKMVLVVGLVAMSLYMLTLRGLEGDVSGMIERHLLKRVATIERQVTVIGYFSSHDYWFGMSYLGLLDAYKSRKVYEDKPPVDTGVYLKAISDGVTEVTPPQPMSMLQATSWPEGNLAGYMNFGILGLIVLCFFSGAILGAFYHFMKLTGYSVGSVLLYSMVSFWGTVNLSPYGIFSLLKIIIVVGFLGLFFRIYRLFSRSICVSR